MNRFAHKRSSFLYPSCLAWCTAVLTGLSYGFSLHSAAFAEDLTITNQGKVTYETPTDNGQKVPGQILSNVVQVQLGPSPPPTTQQVDLALNILTPGKFTVGSSGSYAIDVTNNGPSTVKRFLVSLKGFENVLGTNPKLTLEGLTDRQGNALSTAGITVTQQSDGRWLVDGITFPVGQVAHLRVTGTVQPLAADVVFQVQAEVSSPKQANGALDFIDTVPANNIDLQPEQLNVDLGITLRSIGKLVAGQLGQYSIKVDNNGPAAVDQFLLRLSDFDKIFSNFALTSGTYTVSPDGKLVAADGTVTNLPLKFVTLLDRDRKTALDLSKILVTITGNGLTPDGNILISGFTFIPGQELQMTLEGVLNDVGTAGQTVKVEVASPNTIKGQPLFVDTNVSNNQDDDQLVDPLGRLVDCSGNPFDATGFTAALFDTNDGGVSVTGLTSLPNPSAAETGKLKLVINVNPENRNPFTIGSDGQYNFLFSQDQVRVGRQYVLVITPPSTSQGTYSQRRILMTITGATQGTGGLVTGFTYTVHTLDSLPVNLDNTNLNASIPGAGGTTGVNIGNAAQDYLNVLSTNPDNGSTLICQALSLRVTKVADRVSAAPGDIVIYRVSVENLSSSEIKGLVVHDRLPLGFVLKADSVRAQVNNQVLSVTTTAGSGVAQFVVNGTLPGATGGSKPSLNLIYATEVTPDALRGRGRNFVQVTGDRTDNNLSVNAGPAIATVNLRNGLITDYATLIGRVFVDKNFDGEQQKGEPGVPNAVIFLQNGNRIQTDKDGLFSVPNILPGWYVGTLDLSSIPGYTIAPNPHILERESQSRMVRVEPGGMARMNFAVTPVQQEVKP